VAIRLQQQRNAFSTNLDAMRNRANSLKSHWESAGAEAYHCKIENMYAQGRYLADVLDDFVRKLQEASGIYTAGEQTAKTAAEALPTESMYR
jgi:uncharacterized protein YukE